jgi:hypothetical protein
MTVSERIDQLDITLFDGIESQSLPQDKTAWLALQRSMRKEKYNYLEIGSHLGGSLQTYVIDPQCNLITSIDPRPASQPDDRGDGTQVFHYPDNSTQRMKDNLQLVRRHHPWAEIALLTYDKKSADISRYDIDMITMAGGPHLCLIDGEHTAKAALEDYAFCKSVVAPGGVISFHDDYILRRTLQGIVQLLLEEGTTMEIVKFPGQVFSILFDECPALDDPYVKQFLGKSTADWLWK